MLTGAHGNEVCECPNANGHESCRKIISLGDENDCFLVGPISFEYKDEKCLYTDGFYQRFSNVCRRESLHNEPLANVDSIELNSIGAESNSICTSIGTQTPSVKDATIQTTPSIESLTAESPSDLNVKLSSFSNRRIRNYINYSKLVNSEFTKTPSIESSFKDESTQFGESWESENKSSLSGHKQNCCRKSICQCNDPFFPKDELYKENTGSNIEDEIFYGNVNLNAHRCPWKNDHVHYPETRNNFSARFPMGLHPHPNQYLSFNPMYFDKQSSIICPCYNLLRYNPVIEKCDFKRDNEQCTEKFQVNTINNNLNNCIFDNSQRSTWDCKENFNAQQQHMSANITEATKVNAENKTINNGALANADYNVEVVDENTRNSLSRREHVEDEKDLEKDTEFIDENEQSKPLLGDKSYSLDRKDENVKVSNVNLASLDETGKEDVEAAAECGNGCHCHSHDYTVNSIRIRPNKKKSSRTSPLKVITLLLFGSAFLITGSALKDAYYP